jgi:hypothetical protein
MFVFLLGMEEMILEEVQQFTSFLRQLITSEGQEQPLNLATHFNLPILNALWRIMVGERFEYSDPRLLDMIRRMGEFFERFGNPASLLALTQPWIFKVRRALLTKY